MEKIKIYHFHNGSGGGVLSVIKNLLRFSKNENIENHIIHVINSANVFNFRFEPSIGAVSEQIFNHNSRNNNFFTYKQLAKLLPDQNAIIIAHDFLELAMVSNLGLQNKVIHFLHGDYEYYYELAKTHQNAIDKFITIANDISINLQNTLPKRKCDISYLRFPVPHVIIKNKRLSGTIKNIIFIGRLEDSKGYFILPKIDNLLRYKNIKVNWHIVGDYVEDHTPRIKWKSDSSVFMYGKISNDKVLELVGNMDYYILPSLAEGLPVSLIEAMKAGVIPLVNNIKGGIQEMVINNVTGFKIDQNLPILYADAIVLLNTNLNLCLSLSKNCMDLAFKQFDPYYNTELIENKIKEAYLETKKNKKITKIYTSRLDKKNLPNVITRFLRNTSFYLKSKYIN